MSNSIALWSSEWFQNFNESLQVLLYFDISISTIGRAFKTHWITIWTNDAVEMEHSTENIHNLIESSHLHYITNKFYNTIGFRKFQQNDKNNQKILSFWQKWIFNGKWFHSKKTVRIKTTNIFLEHSIFHRFQQKFSLKSRLVPGMAFQENNILSMNYKIRLDCRRPCLIIFSWSMISRWNFSNSYHKTKINVLFLTFLGLPKL